MAAFLVFLLLGVGALSLRARRRSLRRMGYKRQPNGTFTRVIGEIRVEYRRHGRWIVRTGLYAASDFVAEPKSRRKQGDYAFECGVDALDARFWFWSERPPFAKLLLGKPKVVEALRAFPDGVTITLHGDELVVQDPRAFWANHDRVVRLAKAIAAASRPV